jgi:hypothetical protein
MKPVITCLLLLLCAATVGQAQTITTQFTLRNATANCIPVTTQDGVPVAVGAGAVCPQGFFGGGSMQVTLPNDPAFPGQALTMYVCSTSFISSTIPPVSSTQQAPGSYVQALSCQANYGYYMAQWDGTLTYDYSSVRQTHCSSGRGGYCRTAYYPVMSGGSGILSTPKPPPPPPPPPPPIVVDVNILGGSCDGSLVCTLIPATTDVLTSAVLDVYGYTLSVTNADGSVSTSPLDLAQVYALDDDGTTLGVNASGTLYDANGVGTRGVTVALVLTVDDAGTITVSSGTVELTY